MMTKNLLALSWALQTVPVDSDTQRYLLTPLGNKLEAILEKPVSSQEDWQAIRGNLESILNQNSILAQRYQEILGQLQAWTVEELKTLLPNSEMRKQFQVVGLRTLGCAPSSSSTSSERNQEWENIAIEVATIILKSEKKVAETAKTVLPAASKLTKPGSQ